MKNTRYIATIAGGVSFVICLILPAAVVVDLIHISSEMSLTYGVGLLVGLFMCCWGLDEEEVAQP